MRPSEMLELKRITVIGLGAVGGFLSKCLTACNTVENLLLIDDDKVENKNVSKSIFRKSDIGNLKVDVTKRIIEHISDIKVNTIPEKYNPSMKLPESDLTIDCRDIITPRDSNDIDCKLSISGKRMILDCRKDVDVNERKGYYTEKVSKFDLQNATSKMVSLISNEMFPMFLKNELVYYTSMNDEIESAFKVMKDKINTKDLIYESDHIIEKRVYAFSYMSSLVLEKNKYYSMTVFRSDNPMIKVEIKVGEIQSIKHLCQMMRPLIDMDDYHFFPNLVNNNILELIPEIGAA